MSKYYYLYIRYYSGEREMVEVTECAAEVWNSYGIQQLNHMWFAKLATPCGNGVLLNLRRAALTKIIVKNNSLEHPNDYGHELS